MEKKKTDKLNYLIAVLFVVYMALLVWIILFKLQFSITELDTIRGINLIPFYYDNEVNKTFHLKEILENVLVFVPFGIYLCMLGHEPSFKVKFAVVLSFSLILEISQYLLAVGRTDITDLITNTCGGLIGIVLYRLAAKIFRTKRRTNLVITVFAAMSTIALIGILALILYSN